MLSASLIDRLLRFVTTMVTRIDIVPELPDDIAHLNRVSLGHTTKLGGWAGPADGAVALGEVEIPTTAEGHMRWWVASNADSVLAIGPIKTPERVVPRILVTIPAGDIRIKITSPM